jgi:hypothetical protein
VRQPHALGVVPPPQVSGAEHVSFGQKPPQPLGAPQALSAQFGVQPQTLGCDGVPPPQVWPVPVQVPQLTVFPQLLVTSSQFLPWQAAPLSLQPQPFPVPPPQVSGATQTSAQAVQLVFVPRVVQVVPHSVWQWSVQAGPHW